MRHAFLFILVIAALGEISLAAEDPRSKIHFVAVHSTDSISVPWAAGNPVIRVPFREHNKQTGIAVFKGHNKRTGEFGTAVWGGDLSIQSSEKKVVLSDLWRFYLVEVGTIDLVGTGDDDVYFVSMEGNTAEDWHFNLFNPKKSALITLSYSFAHRDPTLQRQTSSNFHNSEFKKEREFLEEVTSSGAYPIPDPNKWLKKSS